MTTCGPSPASSASAWTAPPIASTTWGCPPRSADIVGDGAARPFGVYVHIPFCASRCDYCAFATWDDKAPLIGEYLDAVVADVERTLADGDHPPATSVFFGGGTPSLVPAEGLVRIVAALDLAPGAEVTVECNPDSVTPASLAAYAEGGVTRLSFGVQSMVPHVLASLGRHHTVDHVATAVAHARAAGLTNLNLDVIYGAAGESLDDWARTLDEVVALDPPHVSAYALTVEAGTPLALDAARHPDDDDQADKYALATERLGAAGLEWYEISNWARPGAACRHNLLYWAGGDYLAFGCAAHGHVSGRRFWNVRTPERYVERVRRGESPVAGSEVLDPDARRLEHLQLAVRTQAGVPADALPLDDPALAGLVDVRGDRAVLTPAGRLLANEVALRLR